MEKKEMLKIVSLIKTAYPRWYDFSNAKALEIVNDLWYSMFGSFDYGLIELAVKRHIETNKYAPSISEIKEIAIEIMSDSTITASAAWMEVKRAVSLYRIDQESKAMELMNPITRRTVRELGGWTCICLAENEAMLANRFMTAYERLKVIDIHDRIINKQQLEGGIPDVKYISEGSSK